ncbi:histone-fold-containing protein [Chlamydoabsidia padenii]|nr:histone-fold-containing protein [Chlamydoabsidia padenii]
MASNNDSHYHHQQPNNSALANAAAVAVSSNGGTAPGGHPVFDLPKFWHEQMTIADNSEPDFKNHPLPLARIKKVMKTDQDVKMISAEAPVLFAKGCEIFITELTKRAWVHAEENKRRTLQRSDIATAISKTDMCDFLIDIVPREEASKASNTSVYDQQQNYANYYQQPSSLSSFAPGQVPQQQQMDASYYPPLSQLTPEQVQQYQLQLQQFAAQQQQQQQQHPYATHHSIPENQTHNQPPQSSRPDDIKHE